MIERTAISDRAQWLGLRRKDITASVAGALLGCHPYVSPYALYLAKAGLVDDDEDSPAMRRGRLLEPVAVQLIREDHPEIRLNDLGSFRYYHRDSEARLGCTPDLLATDEDGRPGIIQIKTVEPSIFRKQWKDESGELMPPTWIVIQALVEAHLTGAEWAAIAAMVVGFGIDLHVVPVPLHAGIIARIKAETAAFWQRIADKRPPPIDYGRDGSLISRLFPADDGSEIDLSLDNRMPELIDELDRVKRILKDRTSWKESIESEIKSKLGTASVGLLGDGRRITWRLQHRKSYTVEATSFRALRVSGATS